MARNLTLENRSCLVNFEIVEVVIIIFYDQQSRHGLRLGF